MKKGIGLLILVAGILLLQNCKGSGGKNFTETSDTVKFFPVNLYIQGQINRVDSFAGLIYKITIVNNTKDSTVITRQQFNTLAQDFLEYDISDKSLHKYYKESDFADATTQSLTFNYTALDNTLPLQSIDVLLNSAGNQLKNIFYSKQKNEGDSIVTEKAGWKNDNSFFINRSVTFSDNKTTTQQNIIVWRFQP